MKSKTIVVAIFIGFFILALSVSLDHGFTVKWGADQVYAIEHSPKRLPETPKLHKPPEPRKPPRPPDPPKPPNPPDPPKPPGPPHAVPEPSTLLLLGIGASGIATYLYYKNKKNMK